MSEAVNDGWIEWAGGECPVERDTRVSVRLGNGWTTTYEAAGFRWDQAMPPHQFDIIAYRQARP